jgi:PadR family transcriptional regulator, regulatory protein PadR
MGLEQAKGQVDLLLLSALAQGEAHGYAVIERIRVTSQEELDMPEGTVYPALHRLEREGLLSSRWDETSGRKRRVYELTKSGRKKLGIHQREWLSFSKAVNSVLAEGT